ncbi:MAG TPA: pilin [Candidatus Saccharimonadales bacterium]|nr:pilin [Candidatus Saccharimonadales bacterium]
MKSFMKKVAGLTLVVPALVLGLALVTPDVAYAQNCTDVTAGGIGSGADCAKPTGAAENLFGDGSIFNTVTNILLFLIGAISVVMLIIGGIRYVVSGGDQGAVTSAKNTILYAIIGIVVAFLAFAAVRFVTDQLQKSTYTGSHVAVLK